MNARQLKAHLICFTVMLTTGVWALHAAAPVFAAKPINAIIDAGKTYAPISPYIYGMFLEHIHNSINGGMWSEMIGDRKFYYPITAQGEAPAGRGGPGGRRGFGAPRRWNPVGPAESSLRVILPPRCLSASCGEPVPLIARHLP
jgi:alpha-N-arabinofuranosidase